MAPSSPLAPEHQSPNPGSHVDSTNVAPPPDGQRSSVPHRGTGAAHHAAKEPTLLHQATIRYSSSSYRPSDLSSLKHASNRHNNNNNNNNNNSPSGPVLVNPAPSPPLASLDMRRKQQAKDLTSPPPEPDSFSFSTLLTSLGPEADDSITAIAEICGKSKMSLADEHGSHLPPLGEAVVHVQREGGTTIESKVNARRVEGDQQDTGASVGNERGGERGPEREGIWGSVVSWLRGSRERRESTGAGKSLRGVLE